MPLSWGTGDLLMHLYVLVRGTKPCIKHWENDLLARYLPYEMNGQKITIQVGVRPVQLYEIAYPEPQHDTMMQLIQPLNHEKRYPKMRSLFRRLLGLKKVRVPKYQPGQLWQQIHKHVDVELLGCKEDVKKPVETELI